MGNKRQLNIEVLRAMSMLLVVTGHYVYWGLKVRPEFNPMAINGIMDWVNYISIEAIYVFSCIGVNIFVMISGYFLVSRTTFRWKSLIVLWLTTVFYSILLYLIFDKPTLPGIINSLFPIYNQAYWFVTIYLGLMLLAPFLNMFASLLTQRQYLLLLLILMILNFDIPYGHIFGGCQSLSWFVFLFFAAGYLRKFKIPSFLINNAGKLTVAFMITFVLGVVLYGMKVGSFSFRSNKINGFIFILSLLVFIYFITHEMNGKVPSLIARCAPYLFGVYLIHQHPTIRETMWTWLIPQNIQLPYAVHCILISIAVLVVCILIDKVRELLFKTIRVESLASKISNYLPQQL